VTGTNTVYRVFDSSGVEVTAGAISDRLKAVPAGGYVVIGDPDGSITNGTTATPTVIRLRNTLNDGDDSNDVIVDTISITGNAESAMDESVSRFPDGADSGVDTNDLVKRSGTLGASNGSLCSVAAGDAVINEVVTDPQHDWDQDGSSTPFDGTMGVGSVNAHDEYVEIKNTSANPMNLEGCVLRFEDGTDERLVLQAADAVPTPSYTSYIRVFSAMGVLQGTAPALTNVEPGGYVVLGDPPGEMNNDSTLSLYSDVLVDTVDFGGDAPNLNAGDAEDESGSRVPDGADTGVGADDFKKKRATLGASNELDECTLALDDCDTNASCSNTAAGFDCTCNAGYEGDGSTGGSGCSDIDECSDGTDDCHANATCTNEIASVSCACDSGFSGNGKTCTDIDECAAGDDDCDQNATCSNAPGRARPATTSTSARRAPTTATRTPPAPTRTPASAAPATAATAATARPATTSTSAPTATTTATRTPAAATIPVASPVSATPASTATARAASPTSAAAAAAARSTTAPPRTTSKPTAAVVSWRTVAAVRSTGRGRWRSLDWAWDGDAAAPGGSARTDVARQQGAQRRTIRGDGALGPRLASEQLHQRGEGVAQLGAQA
jgi:hypothetical protein